MNKVNFSTSRRRLLQVVATGPALPVIAGATGLRVAPAPRPRGEGAGSTGEGVDHALGNHPQYAAPMGFGRHAKAPDVGSHDPDPQLGG